ncbi:hypothetical protein [Chryseobacterium sp. KMC2]|uniref:hypothetical protein n=1 Tax=Chryseobacterium sp. KMC2 TaxID=2800705 RepID=UPI0019250892|nr:hypothetical protein [Chryseobacterium sp. KMC2]MBL3548572.1 hypothetical protein [Chryseobacterium sp. KMC2]
MNPRVLELIKNPKNIQSEDLHLLKEEIHAFPYIQNIRALHLYGVHLYDKESYQKELSLTAAYTTDKKILYQLINGVIQQSPKPETTEEKQASENAQKSARYSFNKEKVFPIKREESSENEVKEEEGVSCVLEASQSIEPIYVNGERNRILFEGEENFLDEEHTEKIDLESTLESGTLVTQKPVSQTVAEDIKEEEKEENTGESFTPETIINEDEISSEPEEEEIEKEEEVSFHEVEAIAPELTVEEETVREHEEVEENIEEANTVSDKEEIADEPEAEISFHGTDSFMPDVKIQVNEEETIENTEISQPNVNKHEDEMRRLIEEVEKKMKEAKVVPQEEKEEPEVVADHEISFAETQNFHFWSTEKEEPAKEEPSQTAPVEEKDEISSEPEEEEIEKEEEVSFHEVEAIAPELTVEEETVREHEEVEENIEEANTVSDKEEIADEPEAEISFHGTDSFMPDVKIQVNEEETIENTEISQPNVNKHEDEMRRLIEEVEKKMKEAKVVPQEEKEEPEVVADHEISFAETQNFHFWSTEKEEPAKEEPSQTAPVEEKEEISEPVEVPDTIEVIQEEEAVSEIQSGWKPMSLETNMPDSLIAKPGKVSEPKIEASLQDETPEMEAETEGKSESVTAVEEFENIMEVSDTEVVQAIEEAPELPEDDAPENAEDSAHTQVAKEEAPVMNVSFFGTDISSLRVSEGRKEANEDSMKEETVQEVPVQKTVQPVVDSNVPGFINTWQSWLKIDRPEEVEKEKPEKKIKVIDNFIENNPKISQLKEESSYVVKEKNDDISHLMTETLANLYFEQKLYTKAIKAFEILIKKNPDKKGYFESKIKEIKDFRSKN